MNRFYCKLNLPFEISDTSFVRPIGTFEHLTELTMFNFDSNQIDSNILQLLSSLGLTVFWTDIFYTPPQTRIPVHLDQTHLYSGMIKMNVHIGSPGCVISWYEPLLLSENVQPIISPTGTDVTMYKYCDVELLDAQCIDTVSFMDASIPHGFVNYTNQPSWILSMAIHKGGTNLKFDEALTIFAKYIDEE